MPPGADARIQQLAASIYKPPLSEVRDRPHYPDLENPLHVIILLVDADTEITMQGMLGFLENATGRHLGATREALRRIGAHRSAELLAMVEACMARCSITWERLRANSEGVKEFKVTSFSASHPGLEFADELQELAAGFELFSTSGALEDVYALLCEYVGPNLAQLDQEQAQTSP
jgi:hypothetical protein